MKNKIKRIVNIENYKGGISLIVLVVTIVVALILISVVTISMVNSIDNANLTYFAKDLTSIQEAAESYYITNNVLPIENIPVKTKDEVLAFCGDSAELTLEFVENSDEASKFYVLDLAKINITKIGYGNKQLDSNDIFVIAYPTMNVYYPYGLEVKDTMYFSVTSKISSITKIPEQQVDTSLTSVISSGGIVVTKYNGWANKMGVNIKVNMGATEVLYMSVGGRPNKVIDTGAGDNEFGFDLLSSIVSGTETIIVPTLDVADAEYIESGTNPLENMYVDILKYTGTGTSAELVGKVRIDLSNFSKNGATIATTTLSSYLTINTAKLTFSSSVSGISEIRYEYLIKYTEGGTLEYYYEGYTDFDSTYMKSKARKAKLQSDLTTTISAPKNVNCIKVAIIDKAGNINSEFVYISPMLYIGYSIDSGTKDLLQLTANMFSLNGIKSVTFSRSIDGINYTDPQLYTLNTTNNGLTAKQCLAYSGFTENTAYIKIVAINYDSSITETRIINIDFSTIASNNGNIETYPKTALNVVATQNSTINGQIPTYYNPIIPKGFKAVEDGTVWPTDWNNGLVLQDAAGNQFVWVPIDITNVTYAKWCTPGTSYDDPGLFDDALPQYVTNELNQIIKYNGFYIARYEAGKEGTDTLVSKKNATVWSEINYANSKLKAEAMYNTSEVRSGLVTGTQWDTVVEWIKDSGKNVVDSSAWGNYNTRSNTCIWI